MTVVGEPVIFIRSVQVHGRLQSNHKKCDFLCYRETHSEKLYAVASPVGSFCTQTGCVAAKQATLSGGDDQCSWHQLGQSMRYAVQHSILPMPDIAQA